MQTITQSTDSALLPDGRSFAFWDCETAFTKTYHVAANHPAASDDNPGTQERPFKTISKAAQLLQPSERVIIHEGIYRETICPVNGGISANAMISYEAAPGEDVLIAGCETWETGFTPSAGYRTALKGEQPLHPHAKVWCGKINPDILGAVNPFAVMNVSSMGWNNGGYPVRYTEDISELNAYTAKRGLLIADGAVLQQVRYPWQLWQTDNAYWIEDDGLTIHFRLENDQPPTEKKLELTIREQGFCPAGRNLSYIRIKGLAFEKFSNGFPPPQKGVISTNCGHHWIIEDCHIALSNATGIDFGFLSPEVENDGIRGGHIIRNNVVNQCGISAICGTPGEGWYIDDVLIEHNTLDQNCWQNAEFDFESGVIKSHWMRNCLIRNNTITNTLHGSGIWIDFMNENTRITGNVIADCKETLFGAIFVEASHAVNQIDHNVIWNVAKHRYPFDTEHGGHGIYEHDSDNLHILRNVVYNAAGSAVYLSHAHNDRIVEGRGRLGYRHQVIGNLIDHCGGAIAFPTLHNFADKNIYGTFLQDNGVFRVISEDIRIDLSAWQEFLNWDINGTRAALTMQLQTDDRQLIVNDKPYRLADGLDELFQDLEETEHDTL